MSVRSDRIYAVFFRVRSDRIHAVFCSPENSGQYKPYHDPGVFRFNGAIRPKGAFRGFEKGRTLLLPGENLRRPPPKERAQVQRKRAPLPHFLPPLRAFCTETVGVSHSVRRVRRALLR